MLSLLGRGLNYAVALRQIPNEGIVCAVEDVVNLLATVMEEVHQGIAVTLRKVKGA